MKEEIQPNSFLNNHSYLTVYMHGLWVCYFRTGKLCSAVCDLQISQSHGTRSSAVIF
jgi:hypothetical protein